MNIVVDGGFILEKTIGKGTFGEVYLTSKRGTDEKFATKKMEKNVVLKGKVKKYFNNELFILKQVKHPNIIRFVTVKQSLTNFFLIFELCNGGSLTHCLKEYKNRTGKPFSQEIVQYLMKQIVAGVAYLHDMKILHRDIKLDNILVCFNNEEDKKNMNLLKCKVKIIDFGFARYLKSECLAQSLLGSPMNMDPHILQKMNKMDNSKDFGYDQKADIWSLGTVCYEMLIGTTPFEASSLDELAKKLTEGAYKIPNSVTLSKEAISFLNGMMQYDPNSRLDAHQLENHLFLVKDVSSFHNIEIKKSNNLGGGDQGIVLNTKSNSPLWTIFDSEIDPDVIDPGMIVPGFNPNDKMPKGITGEEKDILGTIDKGYVDDKNGFGETISSGDKNKVDSEFFHQLFDRINKDYFYLSPLLIPTAPVDHMNNIDPISKFINES